MDAAIVDLALAQHVVFGLDQLRALGLSANAIHKRVATGRLHRIHHGVYSLVPLALLTREGLWMGAVLAVGPGAVLSFRSGAALHRLRQSGASRIDITVPRRIHQRPGLRIHFSTTLTPADLTTVNGIPCTTVARTLFDLACVLPRRPVERACDQAEVLELFDLTAVEDQLARHPTAKGTRTLRAILREHDIGQTLTWSDTEEAFLALTRRAGLPDAHSNYFIDPGDGEHAVRVDFAWPSKRIAVEADSKRFHFTHLAFERDRRRDQRVIAAGWRAIRTTRRQIRFAPQELEGTLLRLHASAD